MTGGNLKLGIFVVVAVTLLVMILLLLGVLDRFKPSVRMETYFDQSIAGLATGAQVRYRGVQIGRVSRIGFVEQDYDHIEHDADTFLGEIVLVEMTIDVATLSSMNVDVDSLRTKLPAAVDAGLRIRMSSSGIGGPTFMEIDYVDPALFPVRQIAWTPDDLYVASAPSSVTSIIDGLEKILVRVSDDRFLDGLIALAESGPELLSILDSVVGGDGAASMSQTISDLGEASRVLRETLEDDRTMRLLEDASGAMAGARSLIESQDPGGVPALIDDLTRMSGALESASGAAQSMVQQIDESGVIADLESMAGELGPAGADLRDLADRLNALLVSNSTDITETIAALRRAALQAQALLEDAEANPSRMIFGDPPPRRSPGGSP